MPVNPTNSPDFFFDDVLSRNPRLTNASLARVLQVVAERYPSVDDVTVPQMIDAWRETRNKVKALKGALPNAFDDRRVSLEIELALLRAKHLFLLALYERHVGTHTFANEVIGEVDAALNAVHNALKTLEQAKNIPAGQSLAARIFADRLPFQFVPGEPPVREKPASEVQSFESEAPAEAASEPSAAAVPAEDGFEGVDEDFLLEEVQPWFQRLLRGLRRLLSWRAADRENNLSARSLFVGMFIFANGDFLRPVEPYHRDTAPVVELSQGIEEEPKLTESVESGEVVEEVEEGAEMGEAGAVFEGSGASSGLFFHGWATPLVSGGMAFSPVLRVVR